MRAWPCEVLVARRRRARTSSSNRPGRLEEILRLDPPPAGFSHALRHSGALDRSWLFRWSFGITNFNPDQISSTAQTLISTRPSGSAMLRTTTSLRSVEIPEDFFGHDTQIMPSGAMAA